MRKSLTALAAAATIAVAALATTTTAEARWWRGGPGPFFGGLAAGAIIGGALAPRYYGYPGYYGYGYDYDGCWRRHWNGWRWVAYRVC